MRIVPLCQVLQGYKGNVKGAKLKELIVSDYDLDEALADKLVGTIDIDCLSEHGRRSLISAGHSIDKDKRWI